MRHLKAHPLAPVGFPYGGRGVAKDEVLDGLLYTRQVQGILHPVAEGVDHMLGIGGTLRRCFIRAAEAPSAPRGVA